MPQLSVKAKILITILMPSTGLEFIVILVAAPNLYIILRIIVIYITLIIYFIT